MTGRPSTGPKTRKRGVLCKPEIATLNGAKLYGPMPKIANGGWPR